MSELVSRAIPISIDIAMNKQEAENILLQCDSYQRMGRLMDLKKKLWPPTWLKLLGEYWSLCDNVWRYADRILFEKPISNIDGPVREMMNDEEWKDFMLLPDRLEIFRGCYEGLNEDGICYSLDKGIAASFPTLNGYRVQGKQPILLHGLVNKSEVVAYKNDRGEREIIIRECQILGDPILLDRNYRRASKDMI